MDTITTPTIAELQSHLLTLPQRPACGKTVRLIAQIVREGGGTEMFKLTKPEDWRKAFGSIRPSEKYKRGMGDILVFYLRESVGWLNSETERRIKESAVREERKRQEAAPPARYSRKEIRALADLMEVCGFESVDLREVGYLFKAFKMEDKQ